MNVWILFNEDIKSASSEAFEIRRFISEGRDMGIDVQVFHPEQFDLLVTEEDKNSILIDGKKMPLPDFLLPRTYVVDTGYFSLAIIRQFERLGVKIFNNAASCEMVSDKLHTHQALVQANIPTPTTMLAKFPVNIELIEEKIGFPIVVKTLLGVNGTGVFLMETHKNFVDLMSLISETNPNIQLIFQKFISQSKGRDIRAFVVDGKVIAAMERRAGGDDFKANISQGGSGIEIELGDDAVALAIRTADVLNLQVAGIDFLYDDRGYTVCEANSFPGFKGLEKYCTVNVPREIFTAMQKHLKG